MIKRSIPVLAVEKIMKRCGAYRVSSKAKILLKNIIEEKAEDISYQAIRYAAHAGRKTVKSDDIKLAFKNF